MRRGLPLFLATVVCLATWQVWLTWRSMEQDRNLAAQRSRDRLEQSAGLAVAELANALDEWDLRIRELNALPPPGAWRTKLPPGGIIIVVTSRSVTTYPPKPLLFVPVSPLPSPGPPGVFDTAEQLEHREQKYDRAIEALRPLAEKPATRAEALLRIARLERKLNHPEAALAAYTRLSRETGFSTTGAPYALLASGGLCQLLSKPGNPQAGAAAVESLHNALLDGRWPLRRETFEYYWSETNRFRNARDDPPRAALELASLVSHLHERWQRVPTNGTGSGGREFQAESSLLIWNGTQARLTALFAPSGWLDSSLKLPANAADIRWRLLSSSGAPPASTGAARHAVRSLADLRLAGRVEFWSISNTAAGGLTRALWLGGVALMLLLVLGGAYTTWRGVNRELRVGQLQSDFVSAVSHEFRSPLTTLRSITELLAHGRLSDEGRRRESYVFLERETVRLQRLVEDLLDFGRMESGRKQYRISTHDVFALVRAAVSEFREEALAADFQIEVDLDSRAAAVEADEEALRRAIRNLLENAVKYSPECRTVWVEGRVNQHDVAISVRDRGMGIDPGEQRQIFQKFVRGDAVKKAGIKGTGIGLAMVRQIVDAMGGDIRLESAAGAGSTFTIVLPLAAREEAAT